MLWRAFRRKLDWKQPNGKGDFRGSLLKSMVSKLELITLNEFHNSGFFIGNPLSKRVLSDWSIQLHNTELRLERRNITGPKLNFWQTTGGGPSGLRATSS